MAQTPPRAPAPYHPIMALTCNIDARGKRVRFILGIVEILTGIAIALVWAWPAASPLAWGVTAVLVALGLFGIWEARAGWCIVRAMGFRTRV